MQEKELGDLSGTQIDGFYVEELLQRRQSNSLYLARESGTDTLVYLEVLHSALGEMPELDGRFRERMRAIQQLEQPAIPSILSIGRTANNESYAAIQYTPGIPLSQQLAQWREADKRLTAVEALTLIRQVADAFTVLHPAGVIHNNLRPDAIVLQEDNSPVLTALGIMNAVASDQTEASPAVLDYTPPEQRHGKPLTERSNIYSLGVILYELLAGHPPKLPVSSWDIFERATLPKEMPLEEAQPGLTAATYELVKTCLWRQEWSRFETAASLVEAIDAAIAAEEAQALHPAAAPWSKRWLYVAVPLIIIAVSIGFLLTRSGPSETSVTPTETAVPQPTETATITLVQPTESTSIIALPSPTVEYNILLLAPLLGSTFNEGDTIIFDWYWPLPLEPDQSFSVNILAGDEPRSIGIVSRPVTGSQYRFSAEIRDLDITTGEHEWYVSLEITGGSEPIVHSERQTFSAFVNTPTVTPAPTSTAVEGELANTATPAGVCVVSPPADWVVYTVQPGDYLFNLAFDTGVTVERVQKVNCLTESIIGTGLKLWLPSLPATPTPIPSPTLIVPTGKPPKATSPPPTKTPPPPPSP